MKNFILLSLLFSSLSLSAQSKKSIDLVGGLSYSKHSYDYIGPDEVFEEVSKTWENLPAKLGWRFGMNFNLSLTDHLWLRSGLRIINVGNRSRSIRITTIVLNGNDGEQQSVNDAQMVYTSFNNFYTELPLSIRYEYSDKALRPFVEIGGAANLYFGSMNLMSNEGISRDEWFFEEAAKPINLSVHASVGIIYDINPHLSLVLQPIARYHLTTTYNSLTEDHFYNLGAEMALRMNL